MISPSSVTIRRTHRPLLFEQHRKTMEWLSAIALWRHELTMFQKMLDACITKSASAADKEEINHLQNVIIYYKDDLFDSLTLKLRMHEKTLQDMMSKENEIKTDYITAHNQLMNAADLLARQTQYYKDQIYAVLIKF